MRSLLGFLNRIKSLFVNNKLISSILKNRNFRINLSLFISLLSNLVYVAFNAVYGIVYASSWFITVAVYYTLLAILICTVLNAEKSVHKTSLKVSRAYLRCGFFLILLDFPMTAMMIYASLGIGELAYNSIWMLELIVFTVYSFLRAVFGIFKSRTESSHRSRTVFTVRLASSLLSIVNSSIALGARDRLGTVINLFISSIASAVTFLVALFLIKSIKKELEWKQSRKPNPDSQL